MRRWRRLRLRISRRLLGVAVRGLMTEGCNALTLPVVDAAGDEGETWVSMDRRWHPDRNLAAWRLHDERAGFA